jgi:TolB protein
MKTGRLIPRFLAVLLALLIILPAKSGRSQGLAGDPVVPVYLPLVASHYPRGRLAFTNNWTGSENIYLIDTNGAATQRITVDAADDHHPTWSPDGTRIAYATDRLSSGGPARPGGIEGSTTYHVYVMNSDSSGLYQLTHEPEGSGDGMPDWSPDGSRIAFVSSATGTYQIYTIRLDGSDRKRVTYNNNFDHDPAWSPDSSRIVYASYGASGADLWITNADGTHPVRLTTHSADEMDPDWSPDGSRIVYDSFRAGNSDLFIINSDGSGETNLTNTPDQAESYPAWSPDGNWIAFCNVSPDSLMSIQLISVDGSVRKQVSLPGGVQCQPAWQP